ncbi:assimilatory sulfite reductase [Schizophyllum commune]
MASTPSTMYSSFMSGVNTPLSSTSTLTTPPSPKFSNIHGAVHQNVLYGNPRIQPSHIIEYVASRKTNTSAVYIYDVSEQAGFGTLTKEWTQSLEKTAPAIDLQTRAGAGLSLIGRLSQGTSHDTGAVLTAYTTPAGLATMAPSLAHLPPASAASRLVLQVPNVSTVGETFVLSPTLASLSATLPLLPDNVAVLLSSTPQQAVDFAAIAYKLPAEHVVHIFDQYSSSREYGHSVHPLSAATEEGTVQDVLDKAGYSFFEYSGDSAAQTVLVVPNGPLALAVKAIAKSAGLGVLVVNVLRPWDEAALRAALPQTAKSLVVFDDVPVASAQGPLFTDVSGSVLGAGIKVESHRVTPALTQEYLNNPAALSEYLASVAPSHALEATSDLAKKLMFFGAPNSVLTTLPRLVEDMFATHKSIEARQLTDYDVFSKKGGISLDRIVLSKSLTDLVPISVSVPLVTEPQGQADFIAILDQTLLKGHKVLAYAKPGAAVLVVSSWNPEELLANLPPESAEVAVARQLRVFTINAKDIAGKIAGAAGPAHDAVQNVVAHLAFLRLYLGNNATEDLVVKAARAIYDEAIQGFPLSKIGAHAWAGLQEAYVATPEASEAQAAPLRPFEVNAIAIEAEDGETVVNGTHLSSWHDAAKHLLFPSVYAPEAEPSDEQYPQIPELRPEIPDRTFLVTCTVNRRLTPLDYDRNVFHLEFDTSGTGLKYEIGEALGVHGWNDEQEVLDFCNWYGVDPNALVTIPVSADGDQLHTRTVFQALQQQIDLFGRPGKSFYTDVADYATSPVEKYALKFIGSAEGVSTFKKLSEKDTVTFADVLRMYPSAKPPIEVLCTLVGDIKPRHYSIASAQAVVGDSVHLLVVTVDWVTPSGTPRLGQCTRYLSGLKIGQKVTVSIKPSVMKLPPSNMQPLIMAGLGTGAAPFRAFLQYRAMLASKGEPIGPVYYYFGSRHRHQEYLYGEEIEAWIMDGIVSRAGLAFSRDGPKKVYIQHKMLEDAEDLARMLTEQEGVFYLCGPTWPVPDVYNALVGAMVKNGGHTEESAGQYLEDLKELERYVLEVY